MSETITIYCKNNNTYKDVPIGSSLLDIYTALGAPLRYRPMNAQVNNCLLYTSDAADER